MTHHPLDDEAPDDVVYHVIATHRNTRLTGVGYDDDAEVALERAKDDLLKKLEEAGGG